MKETYDEVFHCHFVLFAIHALDFNILHILGKKFFISKIQISLQKKNSYSIMFFTDDKEKCRLDQRTKRKRTAQLIPSKDVIHTRIPWSAYASKGADLMPFWFCKSCHIDWVPVECER